jgi:hypothetical protein
MHLELQAALPTLTGMLFLSLSLSLSTVAEVSLPYFYVDVTNMTPARKLGQITKQEKIAASIAGAQAWRNAYLSSDAQERKTIFTALVVAPIAMTRHFSTNIFNLTHFAMYR